MDTVISNPYLREKILKYINDNGILSILFVKPFHKQAISFVPNISKKMVIRGCNYNYSRMMMIILLLRDRFNTDIKV